MKFLTVPHQGDPSQVHQQFFSLGIKLICCRFWQLSSWESENMSFPYWRLYWNVNKGAEISFSGKIFQLSPENIYLIAPCTPFSSKLEKNTLNTDDYLLQGERIKSDDDLEQLINEGRVLHLFVHFNLGLPFDSTQPGIYSIPAKETILQRLKRITSSLPDNYEVLTLKQNLDIQTLIFEALSEIPASIWKSVHLDKRILQVLELIEEDISSDLSNPILAEKSGMALNSFIRKFTEETGISPQNFVQQKRIEKAEISLQYSTDKIEDIAEKCGYRDRFYFSKAFKSVKNFSPAAYRKRFQQ